MSKFKTVNLEEGIQELSPSCFQSVEAKVMNLPTTITKVAKGGFLYHNAESFYCAMIEKIKTKFT